MQTFNMSTILRISIINNYNCLLMIVKLLKFICYNANQHEFKINTRTVHLSHSSRK